MMLRSSQLQGFNAGRSLTTTPATVGGEALAGETDAVGIDFTYQADITKQLYISDITTPANNYNGTARGKLTYTSPSIKLCRQSDGVYRYQSHNLYLNSASPANQSITVVNGGTYNVDITGSVSVTLSGAATGVKTAGSNPITASSTTLTFGSTSGSGTVAVYRTPSAGTYLATAGSAVFDLPFEWDGSGNSLGIRVEESRVNQATWSQAFNDSNWTSAGVAATVGANATTAPDGTTTADKFQETAVNSNHELRGSFFTIGANVQQTVSLYVKAAERSAGTIVLYDTGFNSQFGCTFDVSVPSVSNNSTTGPATIAGSTITDVGNGWYRITVTGNLNGGYTGVHLYLNIFNPGYSYLGVAGFGYYMWGAQIEPGAFATSPIHTFAATVTRTVDAITLLNTAYPYSTTVGSLVASSDWPLTTADTLRRAVEISAATTDVHAIRSTTAAVTLEYQNSAGGAPQALIAAGVASLTGNKAAAAWALNDFAFCVDGGTVGTDTAGTIPTITAGSLRIGSSISAARELCGHVKQITFLKRRATNGELQSKTT
jgi:hypothetical protein